MPAAPTTASSPIFTVPPSTSMLGVAASTAASSVSVPVPLFTSRLDAIEPAPPSV